jgi:hypothetical protein
MASERVNIRKDFFVEIYKGLKRVLPEIFRNTDFNSEDEVILIELYFRINDQYKRWRMEKPEHRTNDLKKAAITMAAVMAMRPIRAYGANAYDLQYFYTNPIFALSCATAILKKPVYQGVESDKIHLYTWLDTLRFESTIPYLIDAEAGALKDDASYVSSFSYVEISQIDMIVQKLTDACRYIDLEQQIYNQDQEP